jgi:class 3 adenylate cyclase
MKLPFKMPHRAEERNRIIGPLIGFGLASLFSILFLAGAFGSIQNFGLDFKFRIRGNVAKIPVSKDLILVEIEEKTLAWEGAFPDDPIYYDVPVKYLGAGEGGAHALATLFSIDYSRPFGRKVDLVQGDSLKPYLQEIANRFQTDYNLKNQLYESMKYYQDLLNGPNAASIAGELAPKFDELVYSEDMTNSAMSMQQVVGYFQQNPGLLTDLAPDRESKVAGAMKEAGNVYFIYDAENYVDTPYDAASLKNKKKIRKIFEKVLGYPTQNRPEDPVEGQVFDAYHNFLVKDFDSLLNGGGKPFKGRILEKIKKDREEKASRVKEFLHQNKTMAFDIPKGLEDAFVEIKAVKPVTPALGDAAAGQGIRKAEFSPNDGTLRMIAPVVKFNGKLYPHVDFLLAMKYLEVEPKNVVFKRDKIILKGAVNPRTKKKGDVVIPLLPGGTMLINWAGVWADTTLFQHMSFKNLYVSLARYNIYLRGKANDGIPTDQQTNPLGEEELGIYKSINAKEATDLQNMFNSFKGRIAIVGVTATGAAETNPMPLESRYKVLGLHANAMNTIIGNLFIYKPHAGVTILIFFGLAVGLGFMAGAVRRHSAVLVALLNFLFMILAASIYFTLCSYAFIRERLDLPLLEPIVLIVLTSILVFAYRFVTEEQEKRKMKGMFSTYVNPQVVDTLIENPDKLKLGGERTHATVFFSDVAGFTTISETLTPEALVELLNEYLTEMTNILLHYGGTLDKYIGDAVVGIFGAPIYFEEHAKNCCFCALDMQAKIAEMRVVWKEQGKHQMQVRCGVNTGTMIAGNMGSTNRFNYTVIGPEVDFGEHMESSGKTYSTQATISEFTRAEADEHIITRFLDITRSSAYDKPVKIYELLAKKTDGLPENKMECVNLHNDAVVLFFQRKFDEALKKLDRIFEIIPEKEDDELITKFLAPTKTLIKRIKNAIKEPPDETFDTLILEATHHKDFIF